MVVARAEGASGCGRLWVAATSPSQFNVNRRREKERCLTPAREVAVAAPLPRDVLRKIIRGTADRRWQKVKIAQS